MIYTALEYLKNAKAVCVKYPKLSINYFIQLFACIKKPAREGL